MSVGIDKGNPESIQVVQNNLKEIKEQKITEMRNRSLKNRQIEAESTDM